MSVETVKLVNELTQAVRVEDWLGETVDGEGVARLSVEEHNEYQKALKRLLRDFK